MIRRILLAATFLWVTMALPLAFSTARAQSERVEVAGGLGYMFGGVADETLKEEGVETLQEALSLDAAVNYGILANVRLKPKMQLELLWDQQPTQLDAYDRATGQPIKTVDVRVDYFHAGLLYSWSQTSRQPFIGGTIGVTRMDPGEGFGSETYVSAGPVFGYRTYLSRYFGIRFHTRLLVTYIPSGELFADSSGEGFTHHKQTFMTEMQVGLGIILGW